MALPINIDDLIRQRKVESARIEYKKDWNPEKVLHTICAFANDIDNWGGGYIIIGIEEDGHGMPILPPCGVKKESIDSINKELLYLCNLIESRYVPVVDNEVFQDKDIIVLWCPASVVRPHKCPVAISKNAKSEKAYYIRKANSTIRANAMEERALIEYAGKVPFDERPNRKAGVNDLARGLLAQYLEEVGSDLSVGAYDRSVADLARDMRLLDGPPEDEHPLNVALMFFNPHPENFFPYAQIEVVIKPDPTGQGMIEQTFKGPIDYQLRSALQYIQNMIIAEKIHKHPDRAEADRHWNYPYPAVEEILANAVYHKAYDSYTPIVVTVTPTELTISSTPGLDRSIRRENIAKYKFATTFYRNRRVGEFLKELELAEGRNTGTPTILKALRQNGSPDPIYDTDDDRTYLRVILPIHPSFLEGYSLVGADEKVSLKDEKVDSKVGKLPPGTEKAALDGKKVDSVVEKVDFESKKVAFHNKIDTIGLSRPTYRNIETLFDKFGFDDNFTRLDVRNILSLERSGASKLLSKLLDLDIIVSVPEEGRGKYRFKVPIGCV